MRNSAIVALALCLASSLAQATESSSEAARKPLDSASAAGALIYEVRVMQGRSLRMSGQVMALPNQATPLPLSIGEEVHYLAAEEGTGKLVPATVKLGTTIIITPSAEKTTDGLPAHSSIYYEHNHLAGMIRWGLASTPSVASVKLMGDVQLKDGESDTLIAHMPANSPDEPVHVRVTMKRVKR